MAQFVNFTRADGAVTDGLNLDSVMSWASGVTKEGEAFVLLRHALLVPTLHPSAEAQPWSTRLTGSEREQFLRAVVQRAVVKLPPTATAASPKRPLPKASRG